MTNRHVGRINCEVPDGWDVLESVELFGPDGVRVTVTGQPCADDFDTAALARRHGELLAEQLSGPREESLLPGTAFAGQPVLWRRVSFGTETDPQRNVSAYLVHRDTAYLASASGPAEAFSRLEGEIHAVIDGLGFLGSPMVSSPSGVEDARAPVRGASRRAPVPDARWASLHQQWTQRATTPGPPSGPTTLSTEELLVIASSMGVGLFPTVDPVPFAALSASERAAVGTAVSRSLVTRGFLLEDDGETAPAEWLSALVDVALFPDLLVEIMATGAEGAGHQAFALRPETMVAISPSGPFGRVVAMADPGDLVVEAAAAVTALLGSGPETEVALRCTWRDAVGLVATELAWSSAVPPAMEEVRAELLAHLPGATGSERDRSDPGQELEPSTAT